VNADPWPVLRGRRRGLTAGDRALWRAWAAAAKVRPLPGQGLPEPAGPPPPPPAVSPAPTPVVAAPAKTRPRTTPPVALEVGQMPGGMEARRWRDLSRGRTRPERVLDLHGRQAQDAHAAVRSFLAGAMIDGLRCVAIVTGKGGAEGGVLRRELPHWLNAPDLRPMLLGAAHPHPSNPGAVHVLLRRATRQRG
jgi:DNA-nicking Smr family endonuclease